MRTGANIRRPFTGRSRNGIILYFHYDGGKKLFSEPLKQSDVIAESFRTGNQLPVSQMTIITGRRTLSDLQE